jgi:acyl-[acyl-carrier-protein]-phospholipid O-acyltransferase / long-chain-fatty-acid--[acyl-carrier-protein] ligase
VKLASEDDRFRSLHRFGSIPAAILAAQRSYGANRVAFEDIEGTCLTYGQLALAGAALERVLRARLAPAERVGLLIPAAPRAISVLLAFWRAGRVPAMLNPTVGAGLVTSSLRTAGCTTVISSRTFVEKGGLGDLVQAVQAAGIRLLWTEDLKAAVTTFDKLAAWIAARSSPRDLGRATEAVVLFTSGTEGAPKGVVLTHGNLLANVAQLQARAPIGPTDRAVSALPLFHTFGLTAGIVLMLATSIRTGLHPSPLHYRVIPELARRLHATILIGTDTFLSAWGRRATAEQFASLRAVVAGGEAVKAATRSRRPLHLRCGRACRRAAPAWCPRATCPDAPSRRACRALPASEPPSWQRRASRLTGRHSGAVGLDPEGV